MHLISDLDLGGAEVAMTGFVTRLDPARFRASVCTLRAKGELENQLRAAKIPLHHLPFRSRTSPLGIWRLSRLMRREKIDIAHTHLRRSGFAGRLAALLARVPVMIHHEHGVDQEPRARQRWFYRFLSARTQAVLCVSEYVRKTRVGWTGADPAPFQVFPNFIDFERFNGGADNRADTRRELGLAETSAAPEPFVLGTVGRLSPIKNHSLFLRTSARLARHHPHFRFLIVGDGRLRADLEREAGSLGIADQVVFTGARTDVPRLLKAMDVFLLTSNSEGFGLAPLEAQAAGVPVVSTDADAVVELVRDGETGLLVKENDPDALAAAVERLLNDPELADKLRRNGIAAARKYDAPPMIARLEALYERLVTAAREVGRSPEDSPRVRPPECPTGDEAV